MTQHPLKINWKRFDGYSFQDMCNDLLVAKNVHIVPLRSGPYKDKGRDAFYFEGTIDDLSGKFIFQHKYHKPRPGKENYNKLKSDLKGTKTKKGEIAKAEEHKADHLIILTNVPLLSSQIDELLSLAKRKALTLQLWDERKIISLLVNLPYVRYFHVTGPEFPMFVPHHHFFKGMLGENPENLLTHETDIMGREADLESCQEFIKSDAMILPIYGPPGQGKSRLVLEFSRRLSEQGPWIPLFMRPDGRNLKDHLEELHPRSKYVLFLEDAHNYYDRLAEYSDLLKRGDDISLIKIVITSRISFSVMIDANLASIQPTSVSSAIRLTPLPRDIILMILKDNLPQISEILLEDLLPIVKDSPLLAVTASQLIKQGKSINELLRPGNLRNLLFEVPLRDLITYCKDEGHQVERYMQLLTILAALQPVSLRNDEMIGKISDTLGFEIYKTKGLIGQLIDFGFLKQYGQMIRLIPDILGTIILEKSTLTPQGASTGLGEKIAQVFSDLAIENLMDNLSDVGRLSFPGENIDILDKIFGDIKSRLLSASNFDRTQIIQKLQVVGARRAPYLLDLIEIMMENPQPDDNHFSHADVLGETTDLLHYISMNPEYLDETLNLLKEISLHEEVKTQFSNYSPNQVISKIIKYTPNKPIAYQDKALAIISRWRDESPEAYELAVKSVSPLFRSTISITRSSGPHI